MKSLYLKTIPLVFFLLLIATVVDDLAPKINRIELSSTNRNVNDGQLRIALASDLHIANNSESLSNIAALWEEVVADKKGGAPG